MYAFIANGAKSMASPNRKQKQSEESADVLNSITSREPESSRPTEEKKLPPPPPKKREKKLIVHMVLHDYDEDSQTAMKCRVSGKSDPVGTRCSNN